VESRIRLGQQARATIRNNSLNFYINELSKVREKTITKFKSLSDEWLFEEKQWGNGVPFNNYYLWFHVFEDEINHRGQIRAIKRILSKE
jgi:uncharacterized damage-inducible protein DinB